LIVINYETLVGSPAAVLQRLYRELEEPWYEHDFDNISHDEPEYDAQLGMPGMHKVRAKVQRQNRESCIPPELLAKYADLNFWLKPEMRRKEIVVL
jgi:sulfotransferase